MLHRLHCIALQERTKWATWKLISAIIGTGIGSALSSAGLLWRFYLRRRRVILPQYGAGVTELQPPPFAVDEEPPLPPPPPAGQQGAGDFLFDNEDDDYPSVAIDNRAFEPEPPPPAPPLPETQHFVPAGAVDLMKFAR